MRKLDSTFLTSRKTGVMIVASSPVRFGRFELDLHSGELRKDGLKVRLADQPLQVLTMLLEHPGEVVTREQLQRRLWPSDTFVEFEHSLNAAVKRLRDALSDSPENPRFIETLPRHGYRFVGQVLPTTNAEPKTLRRAFILPRWALLAASGLLLLMIAITSYFAWGPVGKKASPVPDRRVMLAVLPFGNLSGDPSEEFFSDGVTQEMINQLGHLDAQRLGVIAATSAFKYKKSPKKISEIGRELGVDYILEGSVRQGGGRVRITSQLIAVQNQAHVWADGYERNSSDILLAQTEIARAVARQIKLTLSPQAQQRLGGARPVNPEAYSDYLKGQSQASKWTPEGMARGRAYFEQALQKDPDFALAYLGLGYCYMEYLITRRLPPKEAAIRAKEAFGRALQLDENLGEAYTHLAFIDWQYDWNWPAAEQHFRRAIELSPNNVSAHAQLVIYLAWKHRPEEALAEHAKARALDPLALPDEGAAVWIDYHARDYRPMVEASQKCIAWNPANWFVHYFLGVAYEGSGEPLKAIPEYRKAVELSGNDSDPTAALAYAYAHVGKRAEAKKMLGELLEQSKTSYVSPYMLATIYAGLGDDDKVFDLLEKAYNERSTDLAYFLKADLRMDMLRRDPRFQELLTRIGFPL